MSGIAICQETDRIVFVSDGTAYDQHGVVTGECSKVVLIPECSCVLAQRGVTGFALDLRYEMGMLSDFDHLLRVVCQAAANVDGIYKRIATCNPNWTVYIGGYSEQRTRFETYLLSSRDRPTGAALSLLPFDEPLVAPMPDEAILKQFGILDADEPAEHLCVRYICAARAFKSPNDAKSANTSAVGGFLQLTVLERHRITTEIVHRWRDPVGELIDPARGDAMPEFIKNAALGSKLTYSSFRASPTEWCKCLFACHSSCAILLQNLVGRINDRRFGWAAASAPHTFEPAG